MHSSSTYLSPQQALHEHGYFIQRAVLNDHDCALIRQDLLQEVQRLSQDAQFQDALLEPAAKAQPLATPLHERFRKLSHLQNNQAVWNHWLAHPQVLAVLTPFLGSTIYNKFASAFLKPARIGGETPWHQDIGLWRDQNTHAMNGWLAIDPANKSNGCLQVVPGSHRGDIISHIMYEDSIHAEIPRERCQNLTVEHIELAPGDVLFWHSHLWHYSPPNLSDQSRLGCGGVWINPQQRGECHQERSFHVVMEQGQRLSYPGKKIGPEHQTQLGDY